MSNLNLKAKNVLLRPRITEKAVLSIDKSNVYVFEVAKEATKKSISASVFGAYGLKPIKVRVVNYPAKAVFIRGKHGTKGGGKKAYVYLKKGDKIELV